MIFAFQEVANTQGAAGAGGVAVVAMLPVVEGQLHEAGKGEWAFLLDEGTQDMVQ